MTDYQHMRQIAEGAVSLAIAGAPSTTIEAEGLIRVTIHRLDLGEPDPALLDMALNGLTADLAQLKATFNAWARESEDNLREAVRLELAEREAADQHALVSELGDHAIQLDGLHQGYTGLREIIDRLIDRVSAVAESAAAGDGMMRDEVIGRVEALEERLMPVDTLETFVMTPEQGAVTRAEVMARSVPCTLCGAGPPDACRDETGTDMLVAHTQRMQDARIAHDARGRA